VMCRKLWPISESQQGFTLIEVLVAVAITGFIGVGVATAVFQVINVNELSTNHVIAVKQVENAAYWINRDARMAQIIQPGGGAGFPLNMSWVEWDNTIRNVSYAIINGQLQRSISTNGAPPTQTMVAQNIDNNPDNTNCQYANGVFTFKVTASVSGFRSASETRMAEVIPRSAQ
jgi:prepilin-type N-terminal cleavage/methylation domain-containing protein